MRRKSVVLGAAAVGAAAVLGNAFIGRDALGWFRALHAPPRQLPMKGFVGVGLGYYVIMGYVLVRGIDRREPGSIGWGAAVLIGNEAWNGLLFGRRSTRAAFLGLLAFLVPLGGLQHAVWPDTRSRWMLLPYTAYVVAYDLPWLYRLWRLNPPPRDQVPAVTRQSATRQSAPTPAEGRRPARRSR